MEKIRLDKIILLLHFILILSLISQAIRWLYLNWSSFFCFTTILFICFYDYKILLKKNTEKTFRIERIERKNANKDTNEKNISDNTRQNHGSTKRIVNEMKTGLNYKNIILFSDILFAEFLSKPWKSFDSEKEIFDLKLTSDRRILKGAESSLFLNVQVSPNFHYINIINNNLLSKVLILNLKLNLSARTRLSFDC